MAKIPGRYEAEKHENLDKYMKTLGIPDELIAKLNSTKSLLEVEVKGDKYIFKRKGLKDATVEFKLGEEYDEELPNGMQIKSVTQKDGDNKLKSQSKSGDYAAEIIREFTDDYLIVTIKDVKSGVAGKRYYKRL